MDEASAKAKDTDTAKKLRKNKLMAILRNQKLKVYTEKDTVTLTERPKGAPSGAFADPARLFSQK